MKKFRLLEPDEIECRVSTCTEKGVSLLLYKTARTDADLLDDTYGAERWQNDFQLIDGVLYGGIGIDFSGNGNFIWKWDAGVESNTEAEKGRASDAFKRAGFKHGIGRELYSAPFIWVGADKCTVKKNDKGRWQCFDRFEVSHIGYDDNEHINDLVITLKGKEVFVMGKYMPPAKEPTPEWKDEDLVHCDRCNVKFPPMNKNGEPMTVLDYEVLSRKWYNAVLCKQCMKAVKK